MNPIMKRLTLAFLWFTGVRLSARAVVIGAVALVLETAQVAQAGITVWTSHGPYAVEILALAIDPTTPSTLYGGTYEGAFDTEILGLISGSLVPGSGHTACMFEWFTEPVTGFGRNGLPAHQLTCTDDNPRCDFGTATGDTPCTFHVALCLNVTVSGPCSPTDVTRVQFLSPNEARPKVQPRPRTAMRRERRNDFRGMESRRIAPNSAP